MRLSCGSSIGGIILRYDDDDDDDDDDDNDDGNVNRVYEEKVLIKES